MGEKQMTNSQEEQRAARRIRDILESFRPEERSRILGQVFADRQRNQFDMFFQYNIIEILHIIMKESIKEDNETKRFFLIKLGMYSKIAQALADYLRELQDAMQDLQTDE
jgi:hypothetical protein